MNTMNKETLPLARQAAKNQNGVSLIIVMIILVIVSMLGIAGIQISTMAERGARNDRDMQIAWQSAEAALMDAEFDMFGPGASTRRATFTASNMSDFLPSCGTSGSSIGLCTLVTTGKPAWLTVDFTATGAGARTAAYGTYTGRTFAAGSLGVQPAKVPRYIIEPILDHNAGGDSRSQSSSTPAYVYRVTSMGFGPRDDIQAVVQMLYRN